MRTFLIAAVLLLIYPLDAEAQYGIAVEDGFGVGVEVSSVEYATLGGRAGAVIGSVFEFGLRAFRENVVVRRPSVIGVGPYAALYPVRQQSGIPFSVSIAGDYTVLDFPQNFPTDLIPSPTGDGTGYAFSFDAGIFRRVQVSESADVIPYAEIGGARSHTEPGGFNRYRTEFPRGTLSLAFRLDASDKVRLVIVPSTMIGDGGPVYGVAASAILSRGGRK